MGLSRGAAIDRGLFRTKSLGMTPGGLLEAAKMCLVRASDGVPMVRAPK